MLPWWAGALAAALSYVLLSAVAASPNPSDPTAIVFAVFAGVMRFVVPIVFIAGSVASVVGRARRKALHDKVASHPSHRSLESMSWREFEMLVGEAFRNKGFSVREAAPGADGGVDLELRRDSELHLVQCKQWKAQTVGVTVVRELYGVMAARRAAGGYVVTSGRFTAEARAFATGTSVVLLDGPELHRLIRAVELVPEPSATERRVAAPSCPRCGAPMVVKTAKRGPYAGDDFWSCGSFPRCRGIRRLAPSGDDDN